MNLHGVSPCSTPDNPPTAGSRFDLVGTLVTRIFLHCNLSLASTRAADGGNRKKTALQGRSSISGNLESPPDRWGGAPEYLNLAWGSCTVSFYAWRNPPLVNAAVTAVRKWKYEPAFGWTNMEVRLQFTP